MIPIIEVKNLTKKFALSKGRGEKVAVNGLNLSVGQGEIFGLLGPNGAGKTTTVRMLTLQTKVSGGSIFFAGKDVLTCSREIKEIIGVVPQHLNFDQELTAAENMELHARLHHLSPEARRERINELLDYVGLTEAKDYRPRRMSGGMKRRLLIARALIHRPRVLFLDEPTVALDPQVRRVIWRLIRELSQKKVTIILTTHYIEEAESLCHRVAIMNRGELIKIDTPVGFCRRYGCRTLEDAYIKILGVGEKKQVQD